MTAKSTSLTDACVTALVLAILLPLVTLMSASVEAVLVWLPWTYFRVGERYFEFLPDAWHAPGFWDWFWILFALSAIKGAFGMVKINK